jgi:arylsulfatase A-like enzyme/Tfp pilus assembly protein PilF
MRGAVPAPPKSDRPNLLLVTLDTTRADHIGCYGKKDASTPNLDALSKEGVTFSQMHAHVPLTLPSHADILTGRLPSSLNLRVNGLRLKEGTATLATALKKKGYYTCAAVAAVVIDRNRGLAQGFDLYDDTMTLGPRGGGPPEERRAEETTRAALKAVRSARGPYFLWVHYYDPHYEYRPPEPFAKKFSKQPYDGEIAYMDEQFGVLLDTLRKEGKMDNTILVVAGDHGEGLMEFGEKQHGVFLYEPMMHVPCWMVWKGHLPGGRRVDALCGLTDLAPTLCTLLGITLPAMDGADLAPSIRGKGSDRNIYMESYHGYFTYGWAPLRGILSGTLKYIESPKSELYAWRTGEKDNILRSKPSEAKAMSALLKKYPEADQGERAMMENLLKDPSNAETLRQLMSLGYLSGKGQSPDQKGLLDAKDAISIEGEMASAKELLDMSKDEEGIALLLSILKRNPANVPALSMLGNAYLARKEYEKARVCFEEELRLKPQMETAHLNLGTVYKRQGKKDLAMREYRAALVINPRFPEAASSLAGMYIDQKKHTEALTVLNEALKNGAESGDLYFELGLAEAMGSNFDRARWAFTKSVSLDPTRHESMANLGRIAFQQGKLDEAISQYERAVRLDSRNATYLATLGSLYLNGKDDPDRALQYYSKALSADPYGAEAPRLREMVRDLQSAQKK